MIKIDLDYKKDIAAEYVQIRNDCNNYYALDDPDISEDEAYDGLRMDVLAERIVRIFLADMGYEQVADGSFVMSDI